MEPKSIDVVAIVRGLLGLVVGAVAGYFAFGWLVSQGFYALALPGALMGLAGGYASRVYSPLLGIISGIASVPLLLYCEWSQFPFIADGSFNYFVTHVHQLRAFTWLMLVLGVVFAAWFALGRPKQSASRVAQ